ncbi:CocE/NonD family hydrolase [Roseateles sp.]|uniref:CocE/NonD family hydrolase n=1 Tax=Roseateles sp. TaxID=1971397 RepID=UPI002DFC27E7|nr:CocE/NonD family hydrolase [Roseateles sp.]HEV6968710.1 CocE/NonD family hydrolase [Roseateles sp.]
MLRLPAFLLLLPGLTLAPAARADEAPEAPKYEPREHYTKYEYRIPARDGKKLFTVVYLPKDAGQGGKTYPLLMTRTPYSCGPYGVDRDGIRRLAPSEDFLKAGYIFVCQDVRGRYMSEGTWRVMTPHLDAKRGAQDVDESSDTHDSVQWLIDHLPGNNGKVGLWGISYPGFYAAASIVDSHPAIKAASPQAPIADYSQRDDGYHGGALMLAHNYGFYTAYRPQQTPTVEPKKWTAFDYRDRDAYSYFLRLGNLDAIAASFAGADPDKPATNPFFTELVEHDSFDDYWKARRLPEHLKNIHAAVLTVGGWYDAEDLAGPLAIYHAIERQNPGTPNRLVMGPWVHGGWMRGIGQQLGAIGFDGRHSEWFQKNVLLPFFEQHLRGGADASLAEATVFETGTNVWRRYDAWPPRQAVRRSFYLQAGGRLAPEAPGAAEAFDRYVSDPNRPVPFIGYTALGMPKDYMVADQRFAATRPDVLVYETEPLEEDLTVAGPVGVELFVASTGTDADFVVKLIDVWPQDAGPEPAQPPRDKPTDVEPPKPNFGGYQQLVRGDPLRARFRHGFDEPEALVPGRVEALRFELPDVNHSFRRGHRLMVQVQSSWFPLIDRNPQSFVRIRSARPEDFQVATQTVYRGGARASRIELRVVDPAKAQAAAKP